MAKLNYKNSLIKKLQYRSIYSGSKECDFVLSNFAKNNLEKLTISELESYERFLTLGDVIFGIGLRIMKLFHFLKMKTMKNLF